MSEAAVSVRNLWKMYRRYVSVSDGIKEVLHPLRKKYHKEFWALKDVSFDVKKGEAVGIIGRNGSGKSTLLQILCGVLRPTKGEIIVNGRLAALLELGAGFSPEFTGRENVYMSGALMGLIKKEMDERFQAIADFAEIGDFIDEPVRTYSSGMYVRLAFAAAINVDPDILIVDEALAVGDVAFQLKCINRIKEMREKGVTIILVTQDPGIVRRYCDVGCWVNDGSLMGYGDTMEVSDAYLDFMRLKESPQTVENPAQVKVGPQAKAHPKILSIDMLDADGRETDHFTCGGRAQVRLRYRISDNEQGSLLLAVAIHRNDELLIFGITSKIDGFEVRNNAGDHTVILDFPQMNLLGGSYYIKAAIFDYNAVVAIDITSTTNYFTVVSPYVTEGGIAFLKHDWNYS